MGYKKSHKDVFHLDKDYESNVNVRFDGELTDEKTGITQSLFIHKTVWEEMGTPEVLDLRVDKRAKNAG